VGSPLYRLVDSDPLKLLVRVPERRMGGVDVGRGVDVSTAASPQPVPGRISRLRPEVDPRTRTYEVEIEVPNRDLRLAAGAFAAADIRVGLDEAVPCVPEQAVVTFAGVRKVFVPKDGKAAEKLVVTGRTHEGRTEIVQGLEAGEAIVLSPPAGLVAGAPIRNEAAASGGAK
jgi:RND family efflux transporter MFP subunit